MNKPNVQEDTAAQKDANVQSLKEESERYNQLWRRVLKEATIWDRNTLRHELWSRRTALGRAIILTLILGGFLFLLVGFCVWQYRYLHEIY